MGFLTALSAQLHALADRVAAPVDEQGAPTERMGPRRVERESVARGLTPARVTTILQEADEGDLTRFATLMDEIEDRDLHIVSVLSTRKRSVANLAWHIEAGGERAIDRRAAEFVAKRIKEIDNLEDGLLYLLDALSKGVAMVELDWIQVADGYAVRSLDYRPQRWFRVDPANPTVFRLLSEAAPTLGEPLVESRWMVHTSLAKAGFPSQSGLGRLLVWMWLFKSYGLKDWVSYSELFGAPMRVGKYPEGSKPDDIDDLHAALVKLGVDAVATIAKDMEVEFVAAQKDGGDTYERLLTFLNREISKLVLGQTLTTEEGKSGSRALGQVHDAVRQDLLASDARQLARTLTRDLVRPLVRLNLGEQPALPRFVFDFEVSADLKTVAEGQKVRGEVFELARRLGVPVTIAQVQEDLDIHPVKSNEAVLPPISSQTTPAAGQGGAALQAVPSTEVGMRIPLSGLPRCPACACAGAVGGEPLALADGTGLPPVLQQLDAATAQAAAEGGAAWQRLVAAMQAALLDGQPAVGDLPGRFVDLVGSLNAEHPELAELTDRLADATLTAELIGRAQVAAGEQVVTGLPQVPPREAVAFWAEKAVISPDEFKAMAAVHRARAFTISGWTCLDGLKAAHTAMGEVIAGGGTLAEFEDALEAIAGRGSLSPARLETVFENNIGTAYAIGRDRQQRAPDTLARRPYWRLNTADDIRVRRTHKAQEGVVRRYDDVYWDVWSPPNGHRCRCYKTAHSLEEIQSLGLSVSTGPQDVDPLTNLAWLPDTGWRTDPARAGQDLAWIRWGELPPEWSAAVDAEIRGAT